MIITLLNQTDSLKSYIAGAVVLPASGSVSVTGGNQFRIASDGALHSDLISGSVYISDGVNTYGTTDAASYLNQANSNMSHIKSIDWATFKAITAARKLQLICIENASYFEVFSQDTILLYLCEISKLDHQAIDYIDFTTNYQSSCNSSTQNIYVTTQFELNNKDLKLSSVTGSVGNDSTALCEIKVPGVMANGDGRWIDAGIAWFSDAHPDDRISLIQIVDMDGVIAPAGTVLKTYHDDEVGETNQGWRIPIGRPFVSVETIAGYGFLPAQLYLRITGIKGAAATSGTMYVNLKWGKSSPS